jgi:hypothetical protein
VGFRQLSAPFGVLRPGVQVPPSCHSMAGMVLPLNLGVPMTVAEVSTMAEMQGKGRPGDYKSWLLNGRQDRALHGVFGDMPRRRYSPAARTCARNAPSGRTDMREGT